VIIYLAEKRPLECKDIGEFADAFSGCEACSSQCLCDAPSNRWLFSHHQHCDYIVNRGILVFIQTLWMNLTKIWQGRLHLLILSIRVMVPKPTWLIAIAVWTEWLLTASLIGPSSCFIVVWWPRWIIARSKRFFRLRIELSPQSSFILAELSWRSSAERASIEILGLPLTASIQLLRVWLEVFLELIIWAAGSSKLWRLCIHLCLERLWSSKVISSILLLIILIEVPLAAKLACMLLLLL